MWETREQLCPTADDSHLRLETGVPGMGLHVLSLLVPVPLGIWVSVSYQTAVEKHVPVWARILVVYLVNTLCERRGYT